jgi:hypothetical protein
MNDVLRKRAVPRSLHKVQLVLLIVSLSLGGTALAQSPAVVSVLPSAPHISDADAGGIFAVEVIYGETMKTGIEPTLSFHPDVGGTLSPRSGAWSTTYVADDTYTATYNVADGDVTAANVDIGVGGGQDIDGNPQIPYTEPDAFDIDTENPPAPSVPDLDPGSDHGPSDSDDITRDNTPTFNGTAEADSTVELSSNMDGHLGTTTASGGGAWTFTVPGGSALTDGNHALTAQATDAAGNTGPASTPLSVLIDTQAPNPPDNAGRNPANGAHTNDSTPTFSWDAVASDPGGSGVRDYRIQVIDSALHIDKDAYVRDTDYTPATPLADDAYAWKLYTRDVAGNYGERSDEWTLTVDTQNPACTVKIGTALIYDGDRIQEVTVTYDEAMNSTPAPTIQFQTTTGSWTAGTGEWDGTHRNWTQSFTTSDANELTQGVHVAVSAARDAAGNVQIANTLPDAFDVDTRNPVVVSAVPSLTMIVDANVGSGQFTVTVSYDEAMRATPTPTISFQNPTAGATLVLASDSWTDTRTYVATYNVTDPGVTVYDVDIWVTNACDVAGNVQVTSKTANAFDIDTQNPITSGLTVTGGAVDGNCVRTVTFSATVTDTNGCQNATAIILTSVEPPTANATLGVPYDVVRTQVSSTTATITGKVDVQNLARCPATARVTLDAQDCAGNAAAQASATGSVVDAASPAIVSLVVTPQDGLVDAACEEPVTFSATVTDNCCLDPGNVIVAPSVTNATMTSVVIDKVAVGPKEVRIAGSLLVSDLTGCLAIVRVDVSATDCCANRSETDATAYVDDESIPVINDLWVTPVVEVNAACCFATVEFSANVTDNGCIRPGNVLVTVTLATQNAILENIVVRRVQNGQGRVDVTGSVDVRCLSSCPARVSVRVDAYDCCGSDAVPVSSQSLEGLVIDVTSPEVQDDTDRIREDTPTRLYVLEKDDDNCTRKWQGEPCRCDGVLRIYDIPIPPTYGVAAVEDERSHIRYAPFQDYRGPDEFTYRVIDACGNISTEATVRLEVVPKLVLADGAYATCRGERVALTLQATDPLVTEENVGEFRFTILDGPVHGVLAGNLGGLRYEDPETASVALAYAPAAGFVGREQIDVKFEDPYGESSTAVIDIDVTDCRGQTPPLLVTRGTVLPILLPASFASALGAVPNGITLTAGGGAPLEPAVLEQALSVRWDPALGRHLLLLDTGPLSVASCSLTVPLGNGETVILKLALDEGK